MQLEQWMQELLPRLRRYAQVLTRGDRTHAEDLVQDSLERAYTRKHLWRPDSDARAWLFTIMHNLHANQVRAFQRRTDTTPLTDTVAIDTRSPEDRVFLGQLAQLMEELAPEQREVLFLVAVEGLRYAEVAVLLNVPEGTVMSRLARGREALRLRLQDPDKRLRRIK
jgi:RNA polymerase sigma-70 factor (ECF subfamily)